MVKLTVEEHGNSLDEDSMDLGEAALSLKPPQNIAGTSNRKKSAKAVSVPAEPSDFQQVRLLSITLLPPTPRRPVVNTANPGTSLQSPFSYSGSLPAVSERHRVKRFWLGLSDVERKSFVNVEKKAVLKKMEVQEKHTCSCAVCIRNKTAINEELEGLYDSYDLELERFAGPGEGPPMIPPPRDFSKHPFQEHIGDEDEEEELEEVYSELLETDGRRFIEMMEQLAERRMAREEDAREHISHTKCYC